MKLMVYMNDLVKNGSQFIISTHSPILMTFPDAEIYQLTDDGITAVSYQDTEHFCLTKQFVDCPEQMLKYLLSDK
jgi:predicted ATPase